MILAGLRRAKLNFTCFFIQLSYLGVGLLDMTVSETVVGELTRLYLQHCHDDDDHSLKKTNKESLRTRKLVKARRTLFIYEFRNHVLLLLLLNENLYIFSQNQDIFQDLNHKDIVDLSAVQKLQVFKT